MKKAQILGRFKKEGGNTYGIAFVMRKSYTYKRMKSPVIRGLVFMIAGQKGPHIVKTFSGSGRATHTKG